MTLIVQHCVSSLLTFVGPLALTLKALSLKNTTQSAAHLRYLSLYWPAYFIVSFIQYGIQLQTSWDYYEVIHHFLFALVKVWLFYYSGCVLVVHFVTCCMCAFSRSCLVSNDNTLRYTPNISKFERAIDAPARFIVRIIGAICRLFGLKIGANVSNFEKIMAENPSESFLYIYLSCTCHVPSLGEISLQVSAYTSIFSSTLLVSPPVRRESRARKIPNAPFSRVPSASPAGNRNRSNSRVETPKNIPEYRQRTLKKPSPRTVSKPEPLDSRQSFNPDGLGQYPSPEEFMRHRTKSDGNGNTSTRDAVRAWRAASYDDQISNDHVFDDSAIFLDLEIELKRTYSRSFVPVLLTPQPTDSAYVSDGVSSKHYPNMIQKIVSPYPHRTVENIYDVGGNKSMAPLINIDLKEKMQSFIDTI